MGDRGSQVSVLGVRSMLRLVAGSGVIVSLVFVVSCARSGVQADAGGFGSDDVGTDVSADGIRGTDLWETVDPPADAYDLRDELPDLVWTDLDDAASDVDDFEDMLPDVDWPELEDGVEDADWTGADLVDDGVDGDWLGDGGSEVDGWDADSEDSDVKPFEYAYEPDGVCGMQPYDWLLPEEVGHVIKWQENTLYHLTPELIELLLAEAGYQGLLPITYGTRVFFVRYTTQDRGIVKEATMLVGVPDVGGEEASLQEFPVVLSLHPTMGYADKCAPSQKLEGAAAALLPATLGYIGVAPDYLGMCGAEEPCEGHHPYLVGEPTAISSLDGLRAAKEFLEGMEMETKVQMGDRVALWGASQGGHAALFTDRFAPIYAPEFDYPCVVAVVPPSNLAGQALSALASVGGAAKLGTAFFAAAYLWYLPENPLSEMFNANGPKDYSVFIPETLDTTCSAGALTQGAQSIEDVYNPDFLAQVAQGDLGSLGPWGCMALENSLPTTSVPVMTDSDVLFIIGENDELVDDEVEQQSFMDLCDQGYRMEFVKCADADHTGTVLESISLQIDWLNACMGEAGIPEEKVCALTEAVDCLGL